MNTILDRFTAKIKSIAYGLYQRLTPKAKITFNTIIRTTVSFGLCCVAGIYMVFAMWAKTEDDGVRLIKEVYPAIAESIGVDLSSYNFNTLEFIGTAGVGDSRGNNYEEGWNTGFKKDVVDSAATEYRRNVNGTINNDSMGYLYTMSDPSGKTVRLSVAADAIIAYDQALSAAGASNYEELMSKVKSGEIDENTQLQLAEYFKKIYNTKDYNENEAILNDTSKAYGELIEDIAGTALYNALTGGNNGKVTVGQAAGFVIQESDYDENVKEQRIEDNTSGTTDNNGDAIKNDIDDDTSGFVNTEKTELEENKDYYELLEDYVTSEIFSGIGYATAHPIWALINALMKDFMETLRTEFWVPDPQKLSNINFKTGTLTFYSLYYNIFEISKIIGAIIAVFLFLFGILLGMFSKKLSNIKDTPLQLVARFTIAVLLLTQSGNAAVWFINIIKSLWDSLLNSDPFSTGGTFELTDLLLIGAPTGANVAEEWEINAKNGNFLSTFFDAAIMGNPALHNCAMLIGLIIMWPILKQFFALAVEIIERFLVLCLVYALFPIAVGMLCSSATTNVFKQYLQMLFAQLVILASNNLFVGGFCYLVAQGVPKSGIEGYVFTFGYLKAAQRFDSYLRTLGLSATQTGGNVLQGLGMAAHNVIHMVSVGNEARKGSGRLLTAAGGAVGSTALMTAGKVWGLNSRDVISAASDGQGGLFSKKRDLTSLALNGHKTSVKTNEVEQFMTDFCQNNTAANQTPIRAIDNKSMEKFMQEKGIDMKQVRNVNYGQMSNGTVVVNGIDSNNKNVSYSISSDLPDGKTPNKTLKNSEGYDAGYIYQSAGPKQTMDQSPDTYSEDMKTGKKKRKPYGS